MADREQYTPGPASGVQTRKDGEKWTLMLVRALRHSPEKSGRRLPTERTTRVGSLEADGSLGRVGTTFPNSSSF